MRDLTRRLSALEAQRSKSGYRQVVIVGPGDPSTPDGDDIHVIRIVAVNSAGKAVLALLHNEREPLSEFTR